MPPARLGELEYAVMRLLSTEVTGGIFELVKPFFSKKSVVLSHLRLLYIS